MTPSKKTILAIALLGALKSLLLDNYWILTSMRMSGQDTNDPLTKSVYGIFQFLAAAILWGVVERGVSHLKTWHDQQKVTWQGYRTTLIVTFVAAAKSAFLDNYWFFTNIRMSEHDTHDTALKVVYGFFQFLTAAILWGRVAVGANYAVGLFTHYYRPSNETPLLETTVSAVPTPISSLP